MDILIDLIIWAIKAAAKSREQKVYAPPPVSTVPAPARAVTKPIRVGAPPPVPRTAQARAAATAKAVRPAQWSEVPARWMASPQKPPVPPVQTPPGPRVPNRTVNRLEALRVPLILGEVLGPPVGLRDEVG